MFSLALAPASRQRGVTLVELMIALVLAALVVLAATAMVVTSRTSYRTQDETTRLAESSRFALDLVNRMVRLTGYTNFGDDQSIPPFYAGDPAWLIGAPAYDSYAMNGPDLVGAANSKPGGTAGYNRSDSLTLRYFGANNVGDPDFGAIVDCAGDSVPEPVGAPAGSLADVNRKGRAYNVLYVDLDSDGEPALMCQRQKFDPAGVPIALLETKTLIRGVEEFRVLYGEAQYSGPDPDADPLATISYRTGVGGTQPVTNWDNVVSVKVALLLRSAPGARPDFDASAYDLFGATYASFDPTTRFSPASMTPLSERTRSRRIVQTTVALRNRLSAWPSLNVN